MLTSVESASLTGKLSTSNDVEFGTAKGQLTYTANRHGNGPMSKAFYDYIEENKLEFSAEVNGEQKAIRQLTGYYTMEETYAATVVYDASPDGVLPQITLNNKISVNVDVNGLPVYAILCLKHQMQYGHSVQTDCIPVPVPINFRLVHGLCLQYVSLQTCSPSLP